MEYMAPVKSYRDYWKIYIEIGLLTMLCVTQYFGITLGNLVLTCCVVGWHLLMHDMDESVIGLFCALPTFNLLNMKIGNISMYYLMIFSFWLRYFMYHDWRISKKKNSWFCSCCCLSALPPGKLPKPLPGLC